MNYEKYLYIGMIENIHIFFHSILHDNFKKEISHEIYNVLIHNNLISKHHYVIVLDATTTNINAIIIQYNENKQYETFNIQSLEMIITQLFKKKLTDLMFVKYSYQDGDYEIILLENEYDSFKIPIMHNNILIHNVNYIRY